MKTIYKITLIISLLTLISCGSKESTNNNSSNISIPVKVKKASSNNNASFISASGKIAASNTANLSTRMMGFVTKVYVKVGDKVTKNQLLLSINNTDLQAKKAQIEASILKAKTTFKIAEKDYNRFKNLFEQKSATQKELDDVTAHYNITKANLDASFQMRKEVDAQFSYTNIRAPFTGIITNKFIEKGNMANPGAPLLSIEGGKGFEVTALVPETEISKIQNKTKVNVIVKSVNKKLSGTVSEISFSAKNTGGQYLVKILLDKTDSKILSGMFASVEFPIEHSNTVSNVVLISKEALVHQGQLSGIYTVSQQNTALLRWLRLGKTFGNKIEVLSGLTSDESYIISSKGKLYNGAKISVQ